MHEHIFIYPHTLCYFTKGITAKLLNSNCKHVHSHKNVMRRHFQWQYITSY